MTQAKPYWYGGVGTNSVPRGWANSGLLDAPTSPAEIDLEDVNRLYG
jgi:hypothetical protein